MSKARFTAALAAALHVAACAGGGGGGGGGGAPMTSPPAPTSTPNTSLLNLTSSESFTNVSATGSTSIQQSGVQSSTASQGTATINYDIASRSYTINSAGRSQTFAPANLSAADSTSAVDVYIKTNGATTDTLTLTKPGTAGRLTYEFVGGAYWQRTTTNANSVTGNFDALAYGVETTSAALPRAGRAEYVVDLLGIKAAFGNVVGITGGGLAQVDFARGVIVTHGEVLGSAFPGDGLFSSEATLSSAANGFAGTFRYSDFGLFTGQLQGQFFGPTAQEFGAAFSARNSDGGAVVGAILGRGASVSAGNTSLKSLAVNEFFTADAATLTATLPGSSGTNTAGTGFTSANARSDALIVNYDATSRAYTLIGPDRSQYFLGNTGFGSITEVLLSTTPENTLAGFPYPTFTNLQYVGTKEWFRGEASGGVGGLTSYRIEPFVFGMPTPSGDVPRTGRADYTIGLSGTFADNDFNNLTKLSGVGFLNVDFATGSLTTQGQVRYTEDFILAGPRRETTGTFSGSASISSSVNSFTGPISLTGVGNYSGTMTGRFFGPAAQEIGASFFATDGAGGHAVGTFAGGLDPAAAQSFPTLPTLTSLTSLPFSAVNFSSGQFKNEIVDVAFDPGSSTYTLTLTDPFSSVAPRLSALLNSANRDAAASDASFDVHNVVVPGKTYEARLLTPVPSNPTIALRYASLGQLVATSSTPGQPPDRHYVAFGLTTPGLRMPISGTATYNGVAVGLGTVRTNAFSGGSPPSVSTAYDLAGTTSMSVNFANSSFVSTLNLVGDDILSSATFTFPTLTISGNIQRNTFAGSSGYSGTFFGPNAEEIGGKFNHFNIDSGGTEVRLEGVFVGKR